MLDELFPDRTDLRCVQCEKLQNPKSSDTVSGNLFENLNGTEICTRN